MTEHLAQSVEIITQILRDAQGPWLPKRVVFDPFQWRIGCTTWHLYFLMIIKEKTIGPVISSAHRYKTFLSSSIDFFVALIMVRTAGVLHSIDTMIDNT